MAVAFDAKANGSANPGTSVTYAHTVGVGSDRLLILGISTNATTDKVTTVTYNGVNMNRLTTQQADTTNFFLYLYYLLAPATGANNVVVNVSSSEAVFCASVSYTGVTNQVSFPDSFNKGTDGTGNYTATTTVVASNCWLFATSRSNGTVTAGAGTLIRDNVNTASNISSDSNAAVGTGSQSLQFNSSPGGETGWIIASFGDPSAPVGSTANNLSLLGVG